MCPNQSAVEYPYPQSVAIRLARQSGWTVWMETMCPECSSAPVPVAGPAVLAPVVCTPDAAAVSMVVVADAGPEDESRGSARTEAWSRFVLAGV